MFAMVPCIVDNVQVIAVILSHIMDLEHMIGTDRGWSGDGLWRVWRWCCSRIFWRKRIDGSQNEERQWRRKSMGERPLPLLSYFAQWDHKAMTRSCREISHKSFSQWSTNLSVSHKKIKERVWFAAAVWAWVIAIRDLERKIAETTITVGSSLLVSAIQKLLLVKRE